MTEAKQAPVLRQLHDTASGHRLGELRLNAEATLNALSLVMIDLLAEALDDWAADDSVAAVLITGSGDKAFCAGGDIQALYHAMRRNSEAGEIVDPYCTDFFEREYRLDYRLHRYPKPLVVLGHGIVMGGGLGVFSAARHRVVSERTRLAIPEVNIGLFPDAGATWLLRKLAPSTALAVGLTGVQLNAADALELGLGTATVAHDARHEVLERLRELPWQGNAADDDRIAEALASLAAPALPEGNLSVLPDGLDPAKELPALVAELDALAGRSDWLDRGLATLAGGCPTSAGIVVEQVRRAPPLTLADCFRLELDVATRCAEAGDFQEGVRARIIDKSNDPQWRYGSIAALPWEHVLGHFEPLSPHPLADLETSHE